MWLDWARGVAVVLMVLAHVVDAWTRDADRDRTAYYWAALRRRPGRAGVPVPGRAGHGACPAPRSGARPAPGPKSAPALVRRGADHLRPGVRVPRPVARARLGRAGRLAQGRHPERDGPGADARRRALGRRRRAPPGASSPRPAATVALAMAAPLVRARRRGSTRCRRRCSGIWRPTPGAHQLHAAAVERRSSSPASPPARRWPPPDRARRAPPAAGAGRAARVAARRCRLLGVVPAHDLPGRAARRSGAPRRRSSSCAWPDRRRRAAAGWACGAFVPAALGAPLATLGAASLFVYWVHVELVYGGIAIPIKRRLPLELTLVATVAARLRPGPAGAVGAALGGRPRPSRRCRVRRLVARLL